MLAIELPRRRGGGNCADIQWANEIVEYRANKTIEAILNAIANEGTLPAPTR